VTEREQTATPTSSLPGVHPIVFVLGAVLSVQFGSAVATHLFASVGPAAAAFLRVLVGALVLLPLWRPRLHGLSRHEWAAAVAFGLATAAMNAVFYSALDRIPLGIAVTLEFVGPLGVAVAGSRRLLDGLWAALAAGGIILLTPWGGLRLDPLGIGLALLAGGFWASYILLSARVGRLFAGGQGLAIALGVGTVALLPIAVLGAGTSLLQGRVLLLGAGVGLLSSVIPYSFELEALRRLPTRVFGVLMSTEPAVAAIVGLIFLHQLLHLRAILAVVLVTVAAIGATRTAKAHLA